MKRFGFKMKLKPGYAKEYRKRHEEIWPELVALLRDSGISNYSIYLDEETDTLFAYQELADQNRSEYLPNQELMKRWWDYNKDLMECNLDNSPIVTPLQEVFHMD